MASLVGSHASISSTAGVGLIANHTLAGTGSDFGGTASSIGHGGDVAVLHGTSIKGTSVLVAGGGNVNGDLSAFTGPTGSSMLSAGMASATGQRGNGPTGARGNGARGHGGTGASNNTGASLATASTLSSGVALGGFNSAAVH